MLASHGFHYRYYGTITLVTKVIGSKDLYQIAFTMFPMDDQELHIRRDKFTVCIAGMVS